MALILNIESSTTVCSVSLAQDGMVLLSREVDEGYSHAENLAVFVDEVLKEKGVSTAQLDAVSVSRGPGSFTGLRIGVSLAKGLCYGAGVPLLSIDTLQLMCMHPLVQKQIADDEKVMLCPMLDARRMEVYAAVYDPSLQIQREVAPVILEADSFQEELKEGGLVFFGNGSDKFRELVDHVNAYFVSEVGPSALHMATLSEAAYQLDEFEDVAYFEPFYLKAFQGTTPKKRF
ncbi:MAG: tRNA (adenosine(37)-N6)-threonylcarbamoyltransferase complex dimerization subunit type 1 TsaB [Flavobacteriales bacterium]|nr:tRNA (adenosine(37)-N6)-threonylcarbamoyltransferase complex dimerization subunit type 1 TsaB [Flavobacteriales bacterium]